MKQSSVVFAFSRLGDGSEYLFQCRDEVSSFPEYTFNPIAYFTPEATHDASQPLCKGSGAFIYVFKHLF